MSKRTLIFAALAIVLFVVSLFSVVYDFKPVKEPDEPDLFTDQDEPEPEDLTEDQQKKIFVEKLKAGKEAAKIKREQENSTEIISGNGTEQTTS